jgi:hypothetical protein
MININNFIDSNVSNSGLSSILGGFKPRNSSIKNDNNEVQYTDVHYDNDNDGKWSSGDSFEITEIKK